MAESISLTGQRFGRLVVIGFSHRDERRVFHWRVRCDCGAEKTVSSVKLRSETTKSCGCLRRENFNARTKHGHAAGPKLSPTYHSWRDAINRCEYPNDKSRKWYGGRGIKVCERWRNSFEAFLADMGERPEGKTLDRIDNNGDYELLNCRWATIKEQSATQRQRQSLKPPCR